MNRHDRRLGRSTTPQPGGAGTQGRCRAPGAGESDLHRTAASGMQKLGSSVPVIEWALNHVSGTFRGITRVHARHDYADEVRIALQCWSDRVEEIVGGEPAEVVRLRGKRR